MAQERARRRIGDIFFGDELVEVGVDGENAGRRVVVDRHREAPLAGDEPEIAPGDLPAELRLEMPRLDPGAAAEPAREQGQLGPAVAKDQPSALLRDRLEERRALWIGAQRGPERRV